MCSESQSTVRTQFMRISVRLRTDCIVLIPHKRSTLTQVAISCLKSFVVKDDSCSHAAGSDQLRVDAQRHRLRREEQQSDWEHAHGKNSTQFRDIRREHFEKVFCDSKLVVNRQALVHMGMLMNATMDGFDLPMCHRN